MSLTRIAITIPKDVLAATNARAHELDRSRSRVIVDALRAYLASARPLAVREAPRVAYGSDAFGLARREQLERDLARSPAERLRRAEEASRLAASRRPRRGRRQQIIGFDTFEDFWEWQKASRA